MVELSALVWLNEVSVTDGKEGSDDADKITEVHDAESYKMLQDIQKDIASVKKQMTALDKSLLTSVRTADDTVSNAEVVAVLNEVKDIQGQQLSWMAWSISGVVGVYILVWFYRMISHAI